MDYSYIIHTVEELTNEADEALFLRMKNKQHCLNSGLPLVKANTRSFRPKETLWTPKMSVSAPQELLYYSLSVYTDICNNDLVFSLQCVYCTVN